MKKSKVYALAMLAVIRDAGISPEDKLGILKQLVADESLALFCEKEEEGC